ncbi:HNH endonuclease, partial [Aeromicrobium sp. P5_D10]
ENPWVAPDRMPPTEPAKLAGHGAIGPNLLMYLLCVSDLTAFVMKDGDRQAQVLNVGRTKYEPNIRQRRAVLARQQGVCAAPGCSHTHLEIHHTVFWSRGGSTDLDLLIGLCTRCHHLLHRGFLNITGNAVDGFVFTNNQGKLLRRRRRRQTGHRPAA